MELSHDKEIVTFGYLKDFYYGEPAVVFIGSAEGLNSFSNFLGEIAIEKPPSPIHLNEVSIFRAMKGTKLWILISEFDSSRNQIKPATNNELYFRISSNDAVRFSNLIKELAASENGAHQYLDCEIGNKLNVIVSKDEYTDKIFE